LECFYSVVACKLMTNYHWILPEMIVVRDELTYCEWL